MAIKVKIPKEIKDYQEKIIGGLSWRQLLCLLIAFILAIGIGLLSVFVFRLSIDDASWGIILACMPPMAFGFIRPKGMALEKYLKIILRHMWKQGERPYMTSGRRDLNVQKKKRFERIKETKEN
ncbi:PrgI family protein [Enterococcus casseliflavus]|uniref:PrgI family protein n=1 Tax=Enterococcus casseliflavus TaxID=37734 RepID=UPI0035D6F291